MNTSNAKLPGAGLADWQPRPRPRRQSLEGRYVRIEPLEARRHGDDLYAASSAANSAERFRYLFDDPPASREDFEPWLKRAEASEDPMFFAVIDGETGKAAGRQALMRTDPQHGVIEIGNIYWGPQISRRPASTEAFYLAARHVFEDLGYRRFEWKCDNFNAPSKRAALRYGMVFEGVFRQHMVVKGLNRDTAWYSIIDKEWPVVKSALEQWLDPVNFDSDGQQIRRLEDIRENRSKA